MAFRTPGISHAHIGPENDMARAPGFLGGPRAERWAHITSQTPGWQLYQCTGA